MEFVGIWEWAPQTHFRWLTPHFARSLGYDPTDFQLATSNPAGWQTFVHPEGRFPAFDDFFMRNTLLKSELDVGDMMEKFKLVLSGNWSSDVFEGHRRVRASGGQYKWYYNRYRIIEKDKNGKPTRLVRILL